MVLVNEQALTFLLTVLTGCVLGLTYDIIRIFRRIVRHNNLMINMEDFLFFVLCGFFVFFILFNDNYGEIRFFSLIGAVLGVIIYFFSISGLIVEWGTNLIIKLIRILRYIIKIIIYPIKLIFSFIFFPLRILLRCTNKKLTKTRKWVKIKRKGIKRTLKVIFKKV